MTPPLTLLPRALLAAGLTLLVTVSAQAGSSARPDASVTTLSSGILHGLSGANVGQASIEQQGGRVYVHVTGASRAAGATLELLVSSSARALRAGDHGGPGQSAVRVGLIEQAEVRYALPAQVKSVGLRSIWVWCRSVNLPSAQALLEFHNPRIP